jgi:predicted Rossmann-fold nucleotide-binding protein
MCSHGESNMESLLKLFSLVGKTAVVTGGTRGIGQAMAIAFAEAGADIILIQVYKEIRPSTKHDVHLLMLAPRREMSRTRTLSAPSRSLAARPGL